MNVRVKTLNVPYSVRGVPGAPVLMPLEWKTLETAQPEDFTLRNAAAIVEAKGDIWRDMLDRKQDLAKVLRAGAGLP
jgi:bifunctional non-homologous end joining protein LigD